MTNLPNIDPHASRKGEYVGYREGAVFRIGKGGVRGNLWWAKEFISAPGKEPVREFVYAETLSAMSAKLAGPESQLHY